MKIVDNYCGDIQKRTKKILKKVFGYNSVSDGMKWRLHYRGCIEKIIGKRVEETSFDEIKENKLCYEYARYKTLDRILELYVSSVSLQKYQMKDFEEYGREGI